MAGEWQELVYNKYIHPFPTTHRSVSESVLLSCCTCTGNLTAGPARSDLPSHMSSWQTGSLTSLPGLDLGRCSVPLSIFSTSMPARADKILYSSLGVVMQCLATEKKHCMKHQGWTLRIVQLRTLSYAKSSCRNRKSCQHGH